MSPRPINIDDLLALRWIVDVAVSPDGGTVAFAQEHVAEQSGDAGLPSAYRSGIWVVDAAGGDPHPLTSPEARDKRPVWSPDGSRILFFSDRGPAAAGRVRPVHLWVIPTAGGEARRVTQADYAPADAAWSPEGSQVAFSGKVPLAEKPSSDVRIIRRLKHKLDGEGFYDDRFRHIFILPASGGPARQVTTGDFDHLEPVWGPDGTRLAMVANRSDDADRTNAADIWVLALSSGAMTRLTAGSGPVLHPAWSPDGSWIAYLGHENACMTASNTMLWVAPSDGSSPPRCLTREFDRSLVHHLSSDMHTSPLAGRPVWSPDGRYIFVMVADGGTTQLAVVDVATGAVHPVTSGRRDVYIESYDTACRRVVMAIADAATPGDVWVAEVGRGGMGMPSIPPGTERRLTRVNAALLDDLALSAPQRFEFLASDGRTVEGWVLPPAMHALGRRYPTILAIHGGPHVGYGETFMHEFQVLAAAGNAVVFLNPRGSQGYGQAFTAATHHDWGGRDYADLMEGLDAALARFPFLDPARLGVQGASYAGFMTNWIIGHTSRFLAAVSSVSIANLLAQWGTSDLAFLKSRWEYPGDPWESPTFYWERSPLAYVKDVTTPVLILGSEDDLRCPISESEQFFTALKKLRKDAVFVRFPGESHLLSHSGQPHHRIERLRLIVEWFGKYLLRETSGAV
jgi:dipeptidyl aminopeptidase/acylaminoacyl peptidase